VSVDACVIPRRSMVLCRAITGAIEAQMADGTFAVFTGPSSRAAPAFAQASHRA
jgi:hypothetical protein